MANHVKQKISVVAMLYLLLGVCVTEGVIRIGSVIMVIAITSVVLRLWDVWKSNTLYCLFWLLLLMIVPQVVISFVMTEENLVVNRVCDIGALCIWLWVFNYIVQHSISEIILQKASARILSVVELVQFVVFISVGVRIIGTEIPIVNAEVSIALRVVFLIVYFISLRIGVLKIERKMYVTK